MTLFLYSMTATGALALISLLLLHRWKKVQWVLFLLTTAVMLLSLIPLFKEGSITESLTLAGGMTFTLRVTPVTRLFLGASILLTFLINLFSLSYNDRKHATGIAPLWMLLMVANGGIFLAADWLTFFISWEIMGWTSFFIIAQGKVKSFKAAIYYITLSLIGSVSLLAAIFMIKAKTGMLDMAASIQAVSGLWSTETGFVTVLFLLLLLPLLVKSALGPFFMWPAKAHGEAPDDFSAFLSGVMIKYGAFGILIIILPLFASYTGFRVATLPLPLYILAWFGALTAVWGTLHAIRENDMKRLMAYSTVGHLGFILIALALNTPFSITAALFHIFNHMVFKGTIFLTLAAVKYRTGERMMHKLGGLAYRMPLTFFAFLMSIISAAAIPPMAGFGSKWMIYQSLFEQDFLILVIPAFFASTAAFMYLYRGLHAIFLGQLRPVYENIKEAPFLQSLPMALLMLMSFIVGAFPGLFLKPVTSAVNTIYGSSADISMTSVTGTTGFVNFFFVAIVFIGAFVLTFVLFVLGKSRKKVDALDNYMAGESPEDWNLTPEQYQHAYRFYEPWEKMFNPLLESRLSASRWFEGIRDYSVKVLAFFRRQFNAAQMGIMAMVLFLSIALLGGLLLW